MMTMTNDDDDDDDHDYAYAFWLFIIKNMISKNDNLVIHINTTYSRPIASHVRNKYCHFI